MTAGASTRGEAELRVVKISEMLVSSSPSDVLVTYSLGSCLGIAIHDSVAGNGGLIHCMLPSSKSNPEKAAAMPAMFVDTGVAGLLAELFAMGSRREDLVIKVAGGASPMDQNGRFRVGSRNYNVLRKLLWKNDLLIAAEDVGGFDPRTMRLHMDTGTVTVGPSGSEQEL